MLNYVRIRQTVGPHFTERKNALNFVHSPVYQAVSVQHNSVSVRNFPPLRRPPTAADTQTWPCPKQMNEKCTFNYLKKGRFCLDFVVPGNLKGRLPRLGTIVAL
jgi:hypothetical protein